MKIKFVDRDSQRVIFVENDDGTMEEISEEKFLEAFKEEMRRIADSKIEPYEVPKDKEKREG